MTVKWTMSCIIYTIAKNATLNMGEKIHRFTHVMETEMEALLRDLGHTGEAVRQKCENMHENYYICGSRGRPGQKPKVELSKVNEAFKEEVKVIFVMLNLGNEKHEGLKWKYQGRAPVIG